MKTETFAKLVLFAWSKGYELSMLLDGTPVTLRFSNPPAIGLPSRCEGDEDIRKMIENSKTNKEGHSFVYCNDEISDNSMIMANVIAEIHSAGGVISTDSNELTINTSDVALVGYGAFVPETQTVA